MRLRKLTIRTLPGIDQEFTFEPQSPGVNLVVGPNASGKSSLVRALRYLLGADKSDPPALSLEAEFEESETRWLVTRNGSQIAWRRDGTPHDDGPALPGADQIGLYRLSVESLLDAGDTHDEDLAALLRRKLFGDCDLDALRAAAEPATRQAFGRREQRALDDAVKARRRVESEYVALQRQEATLPDLQRRIDAATAATGLRQHLEHALKLVDAIEARKACARQLADFFPEMDRLRGDELQQLDARSEKAAKLRETLRERQGELESAKAELDRTGLAHAAPAAEMLQAAGEKLRSLDKLAADRNNAHDAAVQAEAAARDARVHLGGGGEPPRIDADACRRAEQLATDLIAEKKRIAELQEQLKTAGEAPDQQEIRRWHAGAEALREWLAACKTRTEPEATAPRWPLFAGAIGALAAAVAAGLAETPAALAAVLAALLAAAAALGFRNATRGRSRQSPPTADAERRFADTDLDPPPQWDEPAVRQRLRQVELECDSQRLRAKQAEGADRLKAGITKAEDELRRQEAAKAALAAEVGFDPNLPSAAFDRFVRLCTNWDQARKQHAEQTARVADFDERITDIALGVQGFLDAWPPQDDGSDGYNATGGDESAAEGAPDLDLLRSTFEHLQRRVTAGHAARSAIGECERAIKSIRQQMTETEEETQRVYVDAGLATADRAALVERLEQLPQWKDAKRALAEAEAKERLVRGELASHPDLIAQADAGQREELQAAHATATSEADERTELIQQQTKVNTRLKDTGKDRRLEGAAFTEDRVRQTLEDKREEALLAEATVLLLGNVELAFETEHEPEILQRARAIFAEVTARAFDVHLRGDGTFAARDLRQGAERTLDELSSGTRMQLLLALRLAWTEAQEQDGRTLPLFLDEALTTSDEERFAVMAQSLERIAGAANGRRRQIFYLSARRHEAALWRQATGVEPAVIDLTAVRFPAAAAAPDTYRVETRPAVPAPGDGESAGEYASRLGVPRFDPHLQPGGVHLFYLLRDDLPLLHALMDAWRITTLGQLEALLASDAVRAAVADEDVRQRLRLRCRAVQDWTDLWRQGRGRPVDRGALEQCAAISDVFIGRVDDLAASLNGDGAALVRALRDGKLDRFRASKADELEQWLADEGYTDDRERLTADDRRRLTLQRVAPATEADARDVNQVVDWLEAAVAWLEAAAKTHG